MVSAVMEQLVLSRLLVWCWYFQVPDVPVVTSTIEFILPDRGRVKGDMRTLRRMVSSAWMIPLLVVIGWGPVFIAEVVRISSPEADASYRPQSFAMHWILITVGSSILAAAFSLVHVLRLIVVLFRKLNSRNG